MHPATQACAAAAGISAAALFAVAWGLGRSRQLQRKKSRRQILALRESFKLRQVLQHKLGIDIGGTLAKIVVASDSSRNPIEDVTLKHSTHKHELCFTARKCDLTLAFLYMAVDQNAEAVEHHEQAIAILQAPSAQPAAQPAAPPAAQPAAHFIK